MCVLCFYAAKLSVTEYGLICMNPSLFDVKVQNVLISMFQICKDVSYVHSLIAMHTCYDISGYYSSLHHMPLSDMTQFLYVIVPCLIR